LHNDKIPSEQPVFWLGFRKFSVLGTLSHDFVTTTLDTCQLLILLLSLSLVYDNTAYEADSFNCRSLFIMHKPVIIVESLTLDSA